MPPFCATEVGQSDLKPPPSQLQVVSSGNHLFSKSFDHNEKWCNVTSATVPSSMNETNAHWGAAPGRAGMEGLGGRRAGPEEEGESFKLAYNRLATCLQLGSNYGGTTALLRWYLRAASAARSLGLALSASTADRDCGLTLLTESRMAAPTPDWTQCPLSQTPRNQKFGVVFTPLDRILRL